jgi:Uma2 family endonuclease
MLLLEKLYTVEEFWEIAQLPENEDRRLELEDGVIVEMPSSSPINTVTAMRIGYFLSAFVLPKDLGWVTGADGGFKVGTRNSRQPDVGFVSKTRAPELPKRFNFAPELAIEIVSPNEDIYKKALEYLRAGTRIVWAVYTEDKTVHVMRIDEDGGIRSLPVGIDGEIDGGDVLPEFKLAVRDIFPT